MAGGDRLTGNSGSADIVSMLHTLHLSIVRRCCGRGRLASYITFVYSAAVLWQAETGSRGQLPSS